MIWYITYDHHHHADLCHMQGTRWSQGSEEEDGEQVLQPGSQDQDQHYVNDADRHHTDQDHHHDPSRKKPVPLIELKRESQVEALGVFSPRRRGLAPEYHLITFSGAPEHHLITIAPEHHYSHHGSRSCR